MFCMHCVVPVKILLFSVQPRAAPTEKLMRRRNTEYHQKTWGAAKHLKDQRECPESKSAPARRSEKKRLSLSSVVPADVSQRSNPQLVGRIVPPDQSGGSPQQARKLFNTPTFTSMAPHIEELCLREGRRSLEHLSITSALWQDRLTPPPQPAKVTVGTHRIQPGSLVNICEWMNYLQGHTCDLLSETEERRCHSKDWSFVTWQ